MNLAVHVCLKSGLNLRMPVFKYFGSNIFQEAIAVIFPFDYRLTYEQDRLLGRIDELLKNFDAELRLLRHDKFRLDITMKNADLRQVTLFEELVLLKEYEKREDVLAEKVSNKQLEKLDMQAKVSHL